MVEAKILKKIPAFSKLSEKQMKQLSKISSVESFAKGDIIFSEESAGQILFFVISGRIKIYKSTPTGQVKTLTYLNKGDIFGEMAIFGGRSRSATARVMEACRILFIKANDFKKFAVKNVDVLLKIIGTLSARLKRADEEIKSLAYNSVLARCSFVLLDLAGQYGVNRDGRIFIQLPFTHAELASYVGTSREVISRMITKLKDLKYIEFQKGKIVILNPSGLRQIIY
ncbi:MAG: Crp/Fnr family transcriptional regulator [Elusimicrobia bacterium]|nr:Crp/Fnr family transcriptional regulator [Elusimicrobiota bacterium]